ncbi:type I phosphomannose isomerase catalytic subunit [Planctomicrobium piriforme]|uniref:Mannose-6-phosphate isomerase n=1 Tax=Planctomicrobium piriforme TaxID=1576369 RepID=A0A1I3BCX4_9PLAN|nr:type I phosphomannose isomerase catalytic subunit [Planctomicrobium piriforme]SFH60128.1 mannose-6-phosphate isomerase [Planctomicrobium piriforme]
MQPLHFRPIIKRALWGGQRLRQLGKPVGRIDDASESWEICDLPGNVSVVADGEFAGQTIRELMQHHAVPLLGRHAGCTEFPLLIKFIDANHRLSLQVHPGDEQSQQGGSQIRSKAEACVVMSASPYSRMFMGLRTGVGETELRRALESEDVEPCLHCCRPLAGDCYFVEPGTVHALGPGVLLAEIQQASDTTFRLHDWGRLDATGHPRELQREAGLAAVNYRRGPVLPALSAALPGVSHGEELVRSPWFVIHRYTGPGEISIPSDDRMHVLLTVGGTMQLESGGSLPVGLGQTVLLPAERAPTTLKLETGGSVLDVFLPD